MAYVSTIISGAASLGVLIGLLSGIFFLVLSALRWVSRVRAELYEEELQRQKKFLINNSYLIDPSSTDFIETRKTSNGYGSTLSGSNTQENADEKVQSHVANSEDWEQRQTEEKIPEKQEPTTDTVQVREYIEKMVENLIGGPLDGTTVGQLSTHSAYENELDFNSTDVTQSNLKRLIKRIISEAMALPNIKEILCRPKAAKEEVNEDFKNKSYEDILATAILNKVIEHFQNKNVKENDTTDGHLKRRVGRRIRRNDDDDELKSNSDWSDTSRSDQLSLTIEEYIEEVTTAYEHSEDEKCELSDFETSTNRRVPFPESGRTVIDGSDDENSDLEEQSSATELVTSTNSWEENWLFQKKRLRSTPNAHHPVPVPMLVPNPSEDFRALVGGVDADDLSDMSDCSDLALEELITKEEEPLISIPKPYNEFTHHSSDEEVEKEREEKEIQLVQNICETKKEEETLDDRNPQEGKVVDVPDEEICDGGDVKISSLLPTSPEVQKDREFSIEHFDLSRQYESTNRENSEGTIESNNEDSIIRCRIAEREKEKWNNPVPMPDNPYSPENIEKREQRNKIEYFRIGTYTGECIDFPDDLSLSPDEFARRKSENFRFTRDYYVNASKHPSGMSSSSSLNQLSEANEQESEIKVTPILKSSEMQKKGNERQPRIRIIDRSQFCLPNVKELAKQFTSPEDKDSKHPKPSSNAEVKLESKHNAKVQKINEPPEKEPEVDYSTVPISEIIQNLQHSLDPPVQKASNRQIYTEIQPATRMEICRKAKSNTNIENCTEKCLKNQEMMEVVRFNGKEVHSLTARSISKEFREGLKNYSCQKVHGKMDRVSSGAESDQGDVISKAGKTSPTPLIDLKNMKKFWEEIITANSNSTKEK